MKEMIVKLLFKISGWLYNKGIIAPQLLECNSIIILPVEVSDATRNLLVEKQKEIKTICLGL